MIDRTVAREGSRFIIPNPTHSVVRRRLTGTGRFDAIAPARGGSLGGGSEFRAALVAPCRRISDTAHSQIVPLGNLRKLRLPALHNRRVAPRLHSGF